MPSALPTFDGLPAHAARSIRRSMPAPESFAVRLVRARALSPSVRELGFERVDGVPVLFAPGQWVNLFAELPQGTTKRSYSIASAPRGDAGFELAVTRVEGGAMSEWLHGLELGRELRAVGPQGLFTRDPASDRPALFVGTGTGLAPLRSMYLAALELGAAPRFVVLLGVRHEDDILYREELERLERAHPGFRAVVTLSKPPSTWAGLSGWVQQHVASSWQLLGEPEAEAYVCGLDRMVKSVRGLLRESVGLDRKRIHHERFD
jgi:CDP-4-dehydro-6-deoxyglucose reductase, E3